MTGALALAEPAGRWEPAAVAATARPDGGGWVLEGTKSWVVDGATADEIAVVARRPGTSGAAGAVPARVSSTVRLPRGWQVRFDPPLRILGNGACRNAHFVLQGDGRRWGARVEAPFCTVVLDHAKVSP